MRLSPSAHQYQKYVAISGFLLAVIIFTGAAVRLTDAGLGCENWPSCTEESFTPEWELHGLTEFGNRVLSGFVAAGVSLTALTAYRRKPRRPDLIRWAWGLVAGVAAQIVLGGVTVLIDLHPVFVGAHYALSMVLLWNVIVLWFRANAGGSSATPKVAQTTRNHGRALVAMATTVALTGTVVTGTGPNSGDSRADRLPFVFRTVVQVHSVAVWIFIGLLVFLAVRLFRSQKNGDIFRWSQWLLLAALVQGAIGYTQYFRGVPPLLVEFHIVGSVTVWCLTLFLYLNMYARPPLDDQNVRPKPGIR